jgi:uncharacterized OsmC-like protein
MQSTTIVVNGVDVTALEATMDAIREQPTLARFEFRARNRWLDGAHNRSEIDGFYGAGEEDVSRSEPFVFDNDEPPVLLGENRGANPVEYLLHGLAGCITTTFVYYAAAHGIELRRVASRLEGDLDAQGLLGLAPVRPGFEQIRVTVEVDSDAPREQIEELIRLAQRRSPVFNTVSQPVPGDHTDRSGAFRDLRRDGASQRDGG